MKEEYWAVLNNANNIEFEKAITYFEKASRENSPTFDFSQTPKETLEELAKKGKIIIAKEDNQIVGLLGYFKGIPKLIDNTIVCEEKQIAHIYCYVIDKDHRGPLSYAVKELVAKEAIKDGCEQISFRAHRDNNILINRLYASISTKVKEEQNTQGVWTNRYIAHPQDWLEGQTP